MPLEPVYIVVIEHGREFGALFATYRAREALLGIATLEQVCPSLAVHLYVDRMCVLRVSGGRWTVVTAQKEQAA